MKLNKLSAIPFLAIAAMAIGCGPTDEYEVTGEVSSAETVSSPITLQFYELTADNERNEVDSQELAELGAFTASIAVEEGASVVVMALADADGDGVCTEGELWAEQELTPAEDGTLPAATLALAADACPAAASE